MEPVQRSQVARLKRRRLSGATPIRLIAAAPVLALVVAACSGTADGYPASTYAPAPSVSVVPGMSMSPDPGGATPSTHPAAPGTPALDISARNLAFDTDLLQAPAGQAFVLEFANNDPGIPHNVEIRDANGTSVFRGQIITGPSTVSYQVPPLAAGSYVFVCDVHPTMTGTLAVK